VCSYSLNGAAMNTSATYETVTWWNKI